MSITLLDVMGDYTSIRTLVSVSRCSKLANQSTKQQIDRKTRSAQEMRQLVLEMFPTIKSLPMAEDVGSGTYYRQLLGDYFLADYNPVVIVSHAIGKILDQANDYGIDERNKKNLKYFLEDDFMSSRGRKNIIEAVQGWRQAGQPYRGSRRLQLISDVARQDFAVICGRITCSYDR
jgi:hypothetical protein